jgi:hypothetical protein
MTPKEIKNYTQQIISFIKLSERNEISGILDMPGVRESLMGNKPGSEWTELDLFLVQYLGDGAETQQLLNRGKRGCEQKLDEIKAEKKLEQKRKEEEQKAAIKEMQNKIETLDKDILFKSAIHKEVTTRAKGLLDEIQGMKIERENLFNSLPLKEQLFAKQ